MAAHSSPTEIRKWQDPQGRGYIVLYHEHQVNYCPGCAGRGRPAGTDRWIACFAPRYPA